MREREGGYGLTIKCTVSLCVPGLLLSSMSTWTSHRWPRLWKLQKTEGELNTTSYVLLVYIIHACVCVHTIQMCGIHIVSKIRKGKSGWCQVDHIVFYDWQWTNRICNQCFINCKKQNKNLKILLCFSGTSQAEAAEPWNSAQFHVWLSQPALCTLKNVTSPDRERERERECVFVCVCVWLCMLH